MSVLNSPIETSVRVLALLNAAYPRSLAANQLVLLDHTTLHTADVGGPISLHPALPIRSGELGVKRAKIEEGLKALITAGLAEITVGKSGVEFTAGDGALNFQRLLASPYALALQERASWVMAFFGDLDEQRVRSRFKTLFAQWSEEFDNLDGQYGVE